MFTQRDFSELPVPFPFSAFALQILGISPPCPDSASAAPGRRYCEVFHEAFRRDSRPRYKIPLRAVEQEEWTHHRGEHKNGEAGRSCWRWRGCAYQRASVSRPGSAGRSRRGATRSCPRPAQTSRCARQNCSGRVATRGRGGCARRGSARRGAKKRCRGTAARRRAAWCRARRPPVVSPRPGQTRFDQ